MRNDCIGQSIDYFGVDLHCDALFSVRNGASLTRRRRRGHFDLPRMTEGGIWCQVLSIFVHPHWRGLPRDSWWRAVKTQLTRFRQMIEAAPNRVAQAVSPEQVWTNYKNNKRSLILEIEGLHPIEDNTERIQFLWDAGVRIFTLTWNNSNKFASSAADVNRGKIERDGLTDAGIEICKQINELGGIIDLSHSSDTTFYDVLSLGISPILSHSCVRELKDNKRNATKEMIAALGEAGGVIGINFFPGFLSVKRYGDVTSDDILTHISAAMEVGGENVAALGSDFDGVSALPADIPDASGFKKIAQKMVQKGFDDSTIKKVMGLNFLQYWTQRSKDEAG